MSQTFFDTRDITRSDIALKNMEKAHFTTVLKVNAVDVSEINMSKSYLFFKRVFDIFSSLFAIIVFSPIFLITAILVKCTTKGPVFIKDKRVGLGGREIKVLKFRSMYIDAESRIKDYLTEEQYQIWLIERKLDNDPRITKVGHFIRKTSIDELPQLFNILGGSMSVIGFRPITRRELDENYTPNQQTLLTLSKPGLSGMWAAYGRSDVSYANGKRQQLELEYLSKRGFFFDLKLILKTVINVVRGKGAK